MIWFETDLSIRLPRALQALWVTINNPLFRWPDQDNHPLLHNPSEQPKMFVFYMLGEAFLGAGMVFNFWSLLSPVPWHSNSPDNSLLKFTPYNEPAGYVPPNPCGSNPLSNETVSIVDTPSNNAANYSNVAVWMGPYGMGLCIHYWNSTSLNLIHYYRIMQS